MTTDSDLSKKTTTRKSTFQGSKAPFTSSQVNEINSMIKIIIEKH